MELAGPNNSQTISNLFEKEQQLIVPNYQRRFSWEISQLGDLWNDISKLSGSEKHFLGTIVFKANTYRPDKVNKMDIIDGQQRITSISILLCAIRDYLKKHYPDKAKGRINKIDKSFYLYDWDNNVIDTRVVLGKLDRKGFKKIMESPNNEIDIEQEKIKQAYDFFKERCLGNINNVKRVKNLHGKVLYNLIYIPIIAENHTDSFKLFESMNNRGLGLSKVDLIKNYVLKEANNNPNINENHVEDIWTDIITNIDTINNLNNPGITFFRQHLMSSKLLGIEDKVTTSKLYEPLFKEQVNKYGLKNILQDLRSNAKLYLKLLNQDIDFFQKNQNQELNNLLRDAFTVSITPFTAFLRAFKEIDKPDILKKLISLSSTLLIRRQITGVRTGVHDTIFNHVAQNAFNEDNPIDYIKDYYKEFNPDNNVFKDNFIETNFPNTDYTKLILSKIEESKGAGGKKVSTNREQVHIEHILPNRYSKNLKKLWLEPFNISKAQHNNFKKKIGNLTLLEKLPNLQAADRTFEAKKEYYTKENTDFQLTNNLAGYNTWGVDKIEERGRELAEIANDIWNL